MSLDWPNLLIGAIVGAIPGLLLAEGVKYLRRPKVTVLGFCRDDGVSFGPVHGGLCKLRFMVTGRSPGRTFLEIEWPKGKAFAKWDETVEPLTMPDAFAGYHVFRPEMVPSTYYQEIVSKREYRVPVVFDVEGGPDGADPPFGGPEAFSGWWYGSRIGYSPDPKLDETDVLRLTLTGAEFKWSGDFSVSEIRGTRSQC